VLFRSIAAVGVCRAGARANQREVSDGRIGTRISVVRRAQVIAFKAAFASLVDNDKHVLSFTRPAVSPVKAVIGVTRQHHVQNVDRTAEEFDAVISVVVHLNEVDVNARGVALVQTEQNAALGGFLSISASLAE